MIVLQATHDIRKVSLWLGHSQLTTTEMYVRADTSEKLEAIEAIVPPPPHTALVRRSSWRHAGCPSLATLQPSQAP